VEAASGFVEASEDAFKYYPRRRMIETYRAFAQLIEELTSRKTTRAINRTWVTGER
jgi:hypothetical protein